VKLVLWDIDGTLVDAAKLGRDAFFEAFGVMAGRTPTKLPPFAGRTDLEIAHDMLALHGIDPRKDLLDGFGDALAAAMAARADQLRARGRALPGARETLERLAATDGVLQSLLTGNIEPNARVKLEPFGLHHHLDFEIGAYGSDHRMRGELVAIALGKAADKRGVAIAPSDAVLVGDTPLDVRAAREGGARAVAVATGPHDECALRDSGADAVLSDLSDVDAVLGAVLA
jgi:phosphoglycolate phosphatase